MGQLHDLPNEAQWRPANLSGSKGPEQSHPLRSLQPTNFGGDHSQMLWSQGLLKG